MLWATVRTWVESVIAPLPLNHLPLGNRASMLTTAL
jgi:hypothetical protein